ncbi:uncharacterized protein BDR25DRAFT_268409 [Lindgomyces ingoldianus]|uniref:Uncharacterized protein n=1 Tax=Lindgomyces ingoldianus TaxID=673940 RepID=A0ACB6QK28_9PLEO|nr:uncharacterized protein BDR25DRAFT_268409 [Lindgomyces ingoldianus]KAF2466491.1 hypothetical protein BDR25DRAFT_268409 [Lindgomyces ingoldianus]
MNGTPRRGPGGFPATPQTAARSPGASSPNGSTTSRPNVGMPLPEVPRPAGDSKTGPLIPTTILDAPTQRFYVLAIYVGLWAWRLYDFYTLAIDEEESLALCLRWCFFDMTFIFCLPLFEIPWLEWSNATAFVLFMLHAALDVMLMFRIGVPVQTWLLSFLAFFFDSELAISERSVKPGPILHNASLILGKQIIHILPEGSAILNPNREPFCLNSSITQLEIPIQINQTEPVEIELIRIDIDTNQNETILIKKGEMKALLKKARKLIKVVDPSSPLVLRHTVKKTGVYLLKKVLDQSKLEVRPRASSLIVAPCPQSRVKPTGNSRCRNDLSNVSLEIEGIAPLRIKYRTTVDGRPREASEFQSLQPDDFVSPLSKHTSQALIQSNRQDVSWARSQKVTVALNETLLNSGVWTYAVEEVEDALGNIINYIPSDDEDRPKQKVTGIQQAFTVHERPNVYLKGCTPQQPLQVAKGNIDRLPIKYGSTGKTAIDGAHTIEYLFTAGADLTSDGDHSPNAELKKQTMKTNREQPLISASGLYTIKSVATEFCGGEVLEPASCLLQNPPEPELYLSSEDIVDKCAGNPIGLRVGLDLIGTPPFTIRYTEQKKGHRKYPRVTTVTALRSTIDLTPDEAGHYSYTFDSITDFVYKERALHNLVLQQDVKPSASAHFIEGNESKKACIDDSVEFDVKLQGEGPWKLEYELVHNGKRTKYATNVEEEHYTIKTQKLNNGGEYTVSLASITDKMGCKEFLSQGVKVNVRHERPKAYFGHIESKQAVRALEGKDVGLPLRLTGEKPWTLEYENIDTGDVKKTTVYSANDKIDIKSAGTYQLLSVRDSICPGVIDEKASRFDVAWIPRPKISVAESATMVREGERFIKEAVCEGDEDTFDVLLSGNPPFDVSYQRRLMDKKNGNTAALTPKELRAVGGATSIRAETSHAGTYEYKFIQLADSKYDHSSKHFAPLTVQQTVNPRPNARFNNPGKTYSYCSREADGEEVIPMTFEGVPPFYLEVEIKHHGTPKPEISIHKNIQSLKYDLKIEHRKLHLGHSAISIRKIRDARGCTRKSTPGGPRVQISVHDAPTATALEDRMDFCVGERLSFALGGQVPFTVYYTFEKQERKASNSGTTFRRLAELPGSFTITGLRDSASECLASLNLTKEIHPIPSVRLSGGLVSEVDIHEGGGTDLEFQFWGTPPFEFTYTRSTNAQRGRKSKVLEIRTEVSHEHHMGIPVQEEGTYEVVSIKDRWCSFTKVVEGVDGKVGTGGQKLLTY